MNISGFKRFLALCGLLPSAQANTAISTAGAGTLTAAGLVGGTITRTGPTTVFTDTTATASLIEAAISAPGSAVGQSWEVLYVNNTAFAATITGGTGVTVSGQASVPGFSTGRFLLTRTALGTITMVGIGASGKVGLETVGATRVLTAAESGQTIILSNATEFDTKLPAPAAGLNFTFIVGDAPETASYTVTTNGTTQNVIHGIISSSEDAAGDGAATANTAVDVVTFVDGKAKIGDWVYLISDGTSWYLRGGATEQDGITLA